MVKKRKQAKVKMVCKCRYYTVRNGALVCVQCGKPAHTVEDKIKESIELK